MDLNTVLTNFTGNLRQLYQQIPAIPFPRPFATAQTPTPSTNIKRLRTVKITPHPAFHTLDETPAKITKLEIEYQKAQRRSNPYIGNGISNTKYTIWSFLPKFFLEQFGRFMNFYFLMVASLQLIKQLTPINPITTWTPLLIIFTISGIKEAIDDYNRWQSDKQFNDRTYSRVLVDGTEQCVFSQHIKVGDIIKLNRDDEVPCDLVLLKSSDLDGNAYLLTSNLDGESNLKRLNAPNKFKNMEWNEVASLVGTIECPIPNPHLYTFDGRLILNDVYIPLSSSQLLLQGTMIKNTEYVYCVAVYTGNETKLGLNKQPAKLKLTVLDKQIERASMLVFVFQLVMACLLGLIGNSLQNNIFQPKHFYLGIKPSKSKWIDPLVIPLRMLLLLSLMIPISLKVSMDTCKYVCSLFISWDLDLFDDRRGECIVSNTSIADELGQVEYLFTDKTGTLTENMMVFKCCSINGEKFDASADVGRLSIIGTPVWNGVLQQRVDELTRILNHNSNKLDTTQQAMLRFYEVLSLCHQVQPSSTLGEVKFMGPSPDEEALVDAAYHTGFRYVGEKEGVLTLEVGDNHIRKYKLLHVLEFSSARKRMSVIVKLIDLNNDDTPYLLLTKGADDTVLPYCIQDDTLVRTGSHLHHYAEQGLRTLTIAYRQLTNLEYEDWLAKYQEASTSLHDRDDALEKCYSELEQEFQLLGCTAIEDRLQPRVPQTIKRLRQAGIKVWMLTGDKLVTAVQIGRSCHMLPPQGMGYVITLSSIDLDPFMLSETIDRELFIMNRLRNTPTNQLESIDPTSTSIRMLGRSIVVDGTCLKWILEDPSLKARFVSLSLDSHTVVCCRATPKQKGEIVSMIQTEGKITMGVGDGGNDVIMIQNANIGIGLRGREGLQAARAADLSITRFHHLIKLVLIHGHYSLHRVRFVALYCFYKSITISIVQAGYQILAGFSGSSLLTTYSLSLYNALYTGLPILLYVLDKDLPEQVLLSNPSLYQHTSGRDPHYLLVSGTFKWFLFALLQGTIALSLGTLFTTHSNAFPSNQSETTFSFLIYSVVILLVQFTLAIATNTFTPLNLLATFGTILFYFLSTAIIPYIFPSLQMESVASMFVTTKFWLIVILTATVLIGPYYLSVYWLANEDKDVVRKVRVKSITLKRNANRFNILNEDQYSSVNNEILETLPLMNDPENH